MCPSVYEARLPGAGAPGGKTPRSAVSQVEAFSTKQGIGS